MNSSNMVMVILRSAGDRSLSFVDRKRPDPVSPRRPRALRHREVAAKSLAMKLPILIHPDPRLKKVSGAVADLSDELRQLADDMLETMYDAPGIGLAAPQVGVSVAADRAGLREGRGRAARPLAMFNPEVIASLGRDATSTRKAACRSPSLRRRRPPQPIVDVRWMDRDGARRRKPSTGSGPPACSTRSTT
jgi:peptide deformylase